MKELVNGRKANAGREWHRQGHPERVDVHDFPDPKIPKMACGGLPGSAARLRQSD